MDFWSKIALDGLVDLLMFSGLGLGTEFLRIQERLPCYVHLPHS